MNQESAKWIIILGVAILLVGMAFYFFGDYLKWVGRLPGDIRIERENIKFYFPITTMILLSLLLNVIIKIIQRIG